MVSFHGKQLTRKSLIVIFHTFCLLTLFYKLSRLRSYGPSKFRENKFSPNFSFEKKIPQFLMVDPYDNLWVYYTSSDEHFETKSSSDKTFLPGDPQQTQHLIQNLAVLMRDSAHIR